MLGVVNIITFLIIIITVEITFRIYRKKETSFVEPKTKLTLTEMNQRIAGGEELLLLDDLVLDVSSFKSEHPGGKFLVEYHIGRDISKFFYGGYVLENNSGMKPYTHSNVARAIVNSLIVGRMSEKPTTFLIRIESKVEVNKITKTFNLKAVEKSSKYQAPSSTDVSFFGKHYLVRSL